MTVAALLVYLVGLAVVFGLRTWLHRRRTGSTGFHGISGAPWSLRWWAGVLFVVALVLGVAALAAAILDIVPAMTVPAPVRGVGLALAVLGLGGVLVAQSGMGASWRIGVDDTERTDLVTGGVFAVVRNPIFTAMVLTQLGFTLAVPSWLSVLTTMTLVTAVELQVRLIEEPYLQAAHGEHYRRYAARTGRFVPRLGHRQENASVRA
jgi:protein-S-isoprenylcysteine O-methyltransferase Ste14